MGGSSSGEINFAGDEDWFSVSLSAGRTYEIDLLGSPTGNGSLTDPLLVGVYDSSGRYIENTSNDDGGIGLNSRFSFTPTESGTFFVSAAAYAEATGSYRVALEDISVSQPQSEFDIIINFDGDGRYEPYFRAAETRWEQIIIGNLPAVNDRRFGLIDDLVIDASVVSIDGEYGIVGRAGPDAIRDGTRLPYHGIMQFDSSDLSRMEAEGTLGDVILHEMGHVFGFSNWFFRAFGLAIDTMYTGPSALAAYQSLSGNSSAGYVPLENNGGRGTRHSHWEEDIFEDELMTGFKENTPPMPLSILTVAAMQDLGYRVNYEAADFFELQTLYSPIIDDLMARNTNLEASPFTTLNIDENSNDNFEGAVIVDRSDGAITVSKNSFGELTGVLTNVANDYVYFVDTSVEGGRSVRLDGSFEKYDVETLRELKGTVEKVTFFGEFLEEEFSITYESASDIDAVLDNYIAIALDTDTKVDLGAGNDAIIDSVGSNIFSGGGGLDRVTYGRSRSDVEISADGASILVTHQQETDTLTSIERVWFTDSALAFDTEGRESAGAGYRLYKAAFDRAPDDSGMGYWISVLDSGTTLNNIANAFIISDEFESSYGSNVDTKAFVTALYNNVLDRDPDTGGLNYWQGLIDGGTLSRAEVLANFSESAENIANTDPLIELGVVYQPYGDALAG